MINEIDYDKYIVIKTIDLKYLNSDEQKYFADSLRKISLLRAEKENKFGLNKYLVLNIDDEFDILYLKNKLNRILLHVPITRFDKENYSLKIIDIGIHLINSILLRKL